MDIARLRLLRAVIATGSIRATAAALGYTPSAVSQQLTALQRETGLRLFERVGRGIEPTEAGRTLAAEAEEVFQALNRVDGVVEDLRAGRIGRLSIGYFGSAGGTWLPSIVAALRVEFPELRLDLRMTEWSNEEPDINIVVEHPDTRFAPRVDMHRLVDDSYVAVVRADDPLAGESEVRLLDLAERAWIDNDISDGACRRVLLAACAEAGFSPHFAVETHDYQTAIPFVSTGIGITLIPSLVATALPAGLVAVPVVSPTPTRHICVTIKKALAHHPAAQRTLALLQRAAGTSDEAVPVP